MANSIVVIDPGHGGTTTVAGSSWNNATSSSGVLEKTMTLEMGQLVRDNLVVTAGVDVSMTRTTDVNLGLSARANVARDSGAAVFVSIHCNGFNGVARGVETFIRTEHGNYNYAEDQVFAARVQRAVYEAIAARDSGTRDRGVKAKRLGVLSDPQLGNTPDKQPCVACLVEIEFIDVPAVDALLNTGANAADVKKEVAAGIANAIREQLGF